jgi:fucose 4-O-acetylase-like acetyltransferase
MEKQRIEFIDLAKGLCILLVVLGHIVPVFNDSLTFVFCFRMPLYFCLSGLFYKGYGGFGNFMIKKFNKIFIPFVAWYLISYAIYYLGRALSNTSGVSIYNILDIFHQNDIFNIPIWFLLCLFWCNIIFAFIQFLSRGKGMYVCMYVCSPR